MRSSLLGFSLFSVCVMVSFNATAQPPEANYDEAKVPKYTLPDPLVLENGERVKDAETWRTKRRPEILRLFEEHMFGKSPGRAPAMSFETDSIDEKALGGKATRKVITARFTAKEDGPKMEMLIYLPSEARKPVPLFVGLNFGGNHTVHADPAIKVTESWVRADTKKGTGNKAPEASRGEAASRWQVEKILARGYGLATIYYGDIDPDFHDSFKNGVHPLFYKPGQTEPAANEWGTIAIMGGVALHIAYKQIFQTQNYGRATAFAVILFVFLFGATLYSLRLTRLTKAP
jgi:hypothetical protein